MNPFKYFLPVTVINTSRKSAEMPLKPEYFSSYLHRKSWMDCLHKTGQMSVWYQWLTWSTIGF